MEGGSKRLSTEMELTDMEVVISIKNVSNELSRLQNIIDKAIISKNDLIDRLELSKKQLQGQIAMGVLSLTNYDDLVSKIKTNPDDEAFLLNTFAQVKNPLEELTLEDCEKVVDLIGVEITRVDQQCKDKIAELEGRKAELLDVLHSVQRLDLLKNALALKNAEVQENFAIEMEKMLVEKNTIILSEEMDENLKAIALATINKNMEDKENEHKEMLHSLKDQMENVITDLKHQQESEVDKHMIQYSGQLKVELRPRLTATTSHLLVVDKVFLCERKKQDRLKKITSIEGKIMALQKTRYRVPSEMKQTKELISELKVELDKLKQEKMLEEIDEKLAAKGIAITTDGGLRTQSGHVMTETEARKCGLLEGISPYTLGLLKEYKINKLYEDMSEGYMSSEESAMSTEDCDYLKKVLGKPLTLALAEVMTKQPTDPIHYLAHWLIKYRYNQELEELTKIEVLELTNERERIAKETMDKILKEEATAAILSMIRRAEEIAFKKHLEQVQLEEVEAEEEILNLVQLSENAMENAY